MIQGDKEGCRGAAKRQSSLCRFEIASPISRFTGASRDFFFDRLGGGWLRISHWEQCANAFT